MRTRTSLIGACLFAALLMAGCSQESSGPAQPEATAAPAQAPEPAVTAPAPLPQEEAAEPASAPEPEAVAATFAPAEALAPTPAPPSTTTPAAMPPVKPAAAAPAPVAMAAPAVTPPARPVAPAPTAPRPAAPTASQPLAATPAALAAAPAPAPKPAVHEPAPSPTADIVDPGGVVEVAATKPGLTRIGSEECGDCHDVQYESWAKDPHAARKPPLDCEGCHGPGSEYKSKSVMKDPDKARAAGLVMPDKGFCGKCHKKGVNDDFMRKAHAHEE